MGEIKNTHHPTPGTAILHYAELKSLYSAWTLFKDSFYNNKGRVHPPSVHTWLPLSLPTPYLDGLHRVVLVQFVDVVGYAGIKGGGWDGVDDSRIVGLLLVPLAVGVDKQGEEAAKDGAAQPHGDHVEHVEL